MNRAKESVLIENEIEANRVMSSVILASCAVILVIWFFMELGFLYPPKEIPRAMLTLSLLLMVAAVAVGRYYRFNKRWIKYMLMAVLIAAYAMLDATFTYNAVILMVIPTVMSSRYFSKKYTIIVAVVSYILFFASAAWGANHGELDLNSLELPRGTVISLGRYTWLIDAVENIQYDKKQMVLNVLGYSYAIKLFLSLITMLGSVMVAEQGRKMVIRQQKLTEESVGVSAELSVAAKIQVDMMPGIFPAFPDRGEFDLYASMTPALQVGGDFYDFYLVDEDHLALVMADVSDKGVPAAMFMIHVKNTISNNVMQGKSPADAVMDANNVLCLNNTENMFVTLWLGILEISTGRMTVCNAGHERPVLRQKGCSFKQLRDTHGFAMGCIPDAEYQNYELQLEPGDKLFLYTDGVPEATDADLRQLGMDTALMALNKDPQASPKQMIDNVQTVIRAFVQEADQFDDITMLAFEYIGKK